ncbi:unnamed protein product [Brassica oleracea]
MASSQHSSAGTMRSTGNYDGPVCHCSKSTSISIAWTDANPGRRFYKCDDHGFVDWSDKEPPCLWQKQSLLEARDKIRHLTEEIKNLRQALSRDSVPYISILPRFAYPTRTPVYVGNLDYAGSGM